MGQSVTKSEFISRIAESTEVSRKTVSLILDALLEGIGNTLAEGGRCQFTGFGTFEVRHRAPRMGRNPRNPLEAIAIPARDVPIFRPGKNLREKVLTQETQAV